MQGFTLLELLVVLIIASLMSMGGITAFAELKSRHELSLVTKNALQFLHQTKKQADDENKTLFVHAFKNQQNETCLTVSYAEHQPNNCDDKISHLLPKINVNIAIIDVKPFLAFYGRRSTAKSGSLFLNNKVGETRIVIASNGRIRFCSQNVYLLGFTAC